MQGVRYIPVFCYVLLLHLLQDGVTIHSRQFNHALAPNKRIIFLVVKESRFHVLQRYSLYIVTVKCENT